MKIAYIKRSFQKESRWIIYEANKIIEDLQEQGFTLTIRQLYYQFVSKDLIPNKQSEYDKLGNIINKARLAGLVDWEAIEDRTRNLERLAHWSSPTEIVEACVRSFRLSRWETQEHRVEVWIEKDALLGVIRGVCEEYDVPYFSCRGYVSQSEMWRASRRFEVYRRKGQIPVIIHLGDHDPSGIDMTRDIQERQELFRGTRYISRFNIKRIALNYDQVEQYNPPPNPAKMTDSRFQSYVSEFGKSCWELDALEPSVMVDLIRENIEGFIDDEKWKETEMKEESYRKDLQLMADNWNEEKH